MVAELLKKQYKPCEPIVLSDMKWLKQSPGALRQAFKRMSDKGIEYIMAALITMNDSSSFGITCFN